MSEDRWNTVLVLGGIRSGKSGFAESLISGAPSVRYVATAVGGEDDPEWQDRIEAHQRRRPQSWTTEETGADPAALIELLLQAGPDETVLVDDLGGWVAAVLNPARQPNNDEADVTALAAAVRDTAARVVLVSPEVGLSLVPVTPVGRAFADALGTTNQALAEASDAVALVVAGQTTWLKGHAAPIPPVAKAPRVASRPIAVPTPATPAPPPPPATVVAPVVAAEPEPAPVSALSGATMTLPLVASGLTEIKPGMDLPLPSADAGPDARERLAGLDLPGGGLGALGEAVEFAAATQNSVTPHAWTGVRVVVIGGGRTGGAVAGTDSADVERRIAEAERGTGLIGRLAGQAGADIAVLRTPATGAMEDGPVTGEREVEAALRDGWKLADGAADAGRDVIVLAGISAGIEAAATAVLAATTGAEPVATLPRVQVPGARFDDTAWMARCAAVRDALHRIRQEPRGAVDILRQVGGLDVAVATGLLLGAAARRIPVLVDGPLGIAAGLVARDLASQTRHWCLLPEAGTLALVRQGADVLGLTPVLQVGLDLGEGANALTVLPVVRTAVGLAAALPVHPALLGEVGDDGLDDEPDDELDDDVDEDLDEDLDDDGPDLPFNTAAFNTLSPRTDRGA
ncbi:bifunctional adenosylcobinamide kinase/adenosylcobinamide-phosphate guanylyltransferase [Actinoplanes xinjiangensis]|uniref:bifunctional adenosylcobinamide kinase/adenosylcobinamide-phosphate guanylyltransferase n=1 Tax=Actinoplanes xinjiangensis TaxID=512350 RepID=UPI0034224E07